MSGNGYGMPSSHAQFAFFFATYAGMFLTSRHQPSKTTTTPTTLKQRATIAGFGMFCAAAIAASRVYLNYHTKKQVLVGCVLGSVFAVAWFSITEELRFFGLVDWFLETGFARFFRIRDLLITEDFADGGWARWEARRLEKAVKKAK
jgi:dolichyldiphosphatase